MLLQKLAQGQHFTGMELVARKAGGRARRRRRTCATSFQPVYVTKQQHSGSGGDDVPTETLTFVYGAMQQNYTKQSIDGKSAGNVIKVWNQVTNSENPLVPGISNSFGASRFLN